jgi:multidrug efflux pump subunit AcrA (membrane-fusion protein)
MKRKTLSLISISAILIIGLTAMLLLTSFKAKAEKTEEPPRIRMVETRMLNPGEQSLTIEADGFLKAPRQLDLVSPVSGKIAYALGGLGGGIAVEEGVILFRLDDRRARLAFEGARIEMVQQVNQFLSVAALSGTPQKEWDAYLSALETAGPGNLPALPEGDRRLRLLAVTKGVISSGYALEAAALDLTDHSLTAPFAGILTGDGITEGSWISPGIPLARLIETGRLELTLSLSRGDLLFLAPGDPVTVERPDDRCILEGRIERIEPQLSSQSQTARVHVMLDVPEGDEWMAGSFVSARIRGRSFDYACRLPREILVGNRIPLYRDDRLVLAEVEILAYDGNDVIISSDFPEGTEYVATLLQNPMEGMSLGREEE